jgi:hypothetical protein
MRLRIRRALREELGPRAFRALLEENEALCEHEAMRVIRGRCLDVLQRVGEELQG